ncbi:MAG: type III secretion system export apparatus subunit SctR [Duodenibacillus sp.]|nr:type III secretion system export apparatus subunit SctR [Duodenibacillus sp.]
MAGFDPVFLILIGVVVGLAPFAMMMTTSYVKIIVVTTLVRNALGVQQVPPTMVMNGLAMILTAFIMAPVFHECGNLFEKQHVPERPTVAQVVEIAGNVTPPLKAFLKRNTDERVTNMFISTAKRIWPAKMQEKINPDSWFFAIPSFVITELTKAFQVGFVLYLAFIAIDLIISNILLAMGMMMVSPTTISLPFKLLLFVTLDGWLKITQGLLLSYH